MGVKELKEVLAKGKVFNDVLKDHKTGGACRYKGKSKAPDIPLDTNLGVGDLTLEALMKREGISYKEAVSVYLAFEDALKQPKSAKNKPKAPANPPPTDVEPEEAMPSKKAKARKVAPKARASREKSKPENPAAGLKRKGASSDLGACEEPPAVRVRSKSSGQRPAKEPSPFLSSIPMPGSLRLRCLRMVSHASLRFLRMTTPSSWTAWLLANIQKSWMIGAGITRTSTGTGTASATCRRRNMPMRSLPLRRSMPMRSLPMSPVMLWV